MKTRYLLVLLLSVSYTIFAQTSDKSIYERIYMQTDKDIYLSGELVWLKLITYTPDGRPLDFSKIGYIELLDESSSQVRQTVELAQGIGNSSLTLPATLPTGYYRLIAYTRYMKNEAPSVFFEKVIGIINPLANEETKKTSANTQRPQIQNINNTISITNRPSYQARNLVELNLDRLPENIHSLSVSVTARDFTSVYPSPNIVQRQNTQKGTMTDKYLAEYEGPIVTGKLVENSTNAPAPYDEMVTPVIAFPGKDIRFFMGKMNENGDILFITRHTGGSKEIISSVTGTNADKYRVEIESPFELKHQPRQLSPLNTDMDKDKLLERSMAVQVLYSYMGDSLNQYQPLKNLFYQTPDKTYIMEEYTKFATMQEVVTKFVSFVRFRRLYGKRYLSVFREDIGYSFGNTLVLLDGIPVFEHEIVFNYSPLSIKKIDIYFDRYSFGTNWYEGIMHFQTHNSNYPDLKPDAPTRFFSYEGTQPQRMFYSPVYQTESDRQNRLPDFRHTLYWDPDVATDNKNSISIPFYTSDLTGDFQIVVEGLTKDGKPIYATSNFRVE